MLQTTAHAYIVTDDQILGGEPIIAMYAIYTCENVEELKGEEDDGMVGLNEAEELLRQLREDERVEFERVKNLRNGIRSGRSSSTRGRNVFCQAGRYQQLMLVDDSRHIITRDVPAILKLLRCSKDEPTQRLDANHNRLVSQVRAAFAREARQQCVEQQHTASLFGS